MNIKLRNYFLFAVLLPCLSCAARDYTNWMAELPDEAFVCTLSIPGTHDTATGYNFTSSITKSFSQTQDKNLSEQMAMGVRAFDFRLGEKNDRIRCYHGMAEIELWFDDALTEICNYLDNHPDEFFFIHLYKAEDKTNTDNLGSMLTTLIDNEHIRNHICSFRPDLKAKDMRGKILFLKRWEVNWNSDKTANLWDWSETDFENNEHYVKNLYEDQKCRIVMQDKANSSADEKFNHWRALFTYSSGYAPANERDMVWIMNFASSYNGSTSSSKTYCENASKVQPKIIDLLKEETGPTGIVLLDWVGNGERKFNLIYKYTVPGEDAVHAIADNNFRYIFQLTDAHSVNTPDYSEVELGNKISRSMFRGNVEWMDVNSNGNMDLVVKGRDLSDGWWPKYMYLPNSGTILNAGEYLPRAYSENEYDENRSRIVVPIDYNADGHIDMIYGCAGGSALISNDGTGNFSQMSAFTLYGQDINLDGPGDNAIESRGAYGIMLSADFDMDGYADILTYSRGDNHTDGTPFIFRNESRDFGCAFFGKSCGIPALRNGSMAIGDYNNDGAPDVLISGLDSNGKRCISICENYGFEDGYFVFNVISPEIMQPYATDLGAVAFVDINNDGLLDVFVTGRIHEGDQSQNYASNLFVNRGNDEFERVYLPAPGAASGGFDWCDINNDGYIDLIFGGSAKIFAGCDNEKNPIYFNENTTILMNQGDGTFRADNSMLQGLRSGVTVRAYDYNKDGHAAIAMMGYGPNTFYLYEANINPTGTYSVREQAPIFPTLSKGNGQITLNWDGENDGTRYNYVIETTDHEILAAVPVNQYTGDIRTSNIDTATTGNVVTLNISPDRVFSYGVQAINHAKQAGPIVMRSPEGDIMTGIGDINSEPCPNDTEYYNLQGIKVDKPSKGIYIERLGSRVIKRCIH